MKTLQTVYFDKCDPNFASPLGSFTDEKDYIFVCRNEMLKCGILHTVLEPGDGTRYEFVITQLRRSVVICQPLNGWSAQVGSPPMPVPSYLEEKAQRKINPWTSALVCELMARIWDTGLAGRFYDLGKGKLILKELV